MGSPNSPLGILPDGLVLVRDPRLRVEPNLGRPSYLEIWVNRSGKSGRMQFIFQSETGRSPRLTGQAAVSLQRWWPVCSTLNSCSAHAGHSSPQSYCSWRGTANRPVFLATTSTRFRPTQTTRRLRATLGGTSFSLPLRGSSASGERLQACVSGPFLINEVSIGIYHYMAQCYVVLGCSGPLAVTCIAPTGSAGLVAVAEVTISGAGQLGLPRAAKPALAAMTALPAERAAGAGPRLPLALSQAPRSLPRLLSSLRKLFTATGASSTL